MASPVGRPPIQGNGFDQMKATVLGWIREELGKAAQGGIGLHVDGATGNLIIDEGEVQSGNYAAGSTGWALFPTGSAEFNSLTLRGGIIGNDALTNPVSVGLASNTQTNFAVATTQGTFAATPLTVPAGFTSVIIWSWAGASIYNSTASSMYTYLESGPAGAGSGLPWTALAASTVTMSIDGVVARSGLTAGSTLTTYALIQAGAAIPANTSNTAWTRVMALWFR